MDNEFFTPHPSFLSMLPWYINNELLLILAYLLGSLPTGYLVGRLLKGIDIREVGSGSTGATNVLRTLGKGPAIVVLLVDVLKGVLAIAAVNFAFARLPGWLYYTKAVDGNLANWQPWMIVLAGLLVLLGHSKPIWLNFKGGKSVATSLGVLLAMDWRIGLSTIAVFAVSLAISRIVSLSSITGAISVTALMIAFRQPLPYCLFAIAGGVYVIWLHRTNIQRLLAGTEPQLGQALPEQPGEGG